MIELKVEEYCQNCEHFYPCIENKSVIMGDTGDVICYTLVGCDRLKECRIMYKRIERFLKERKDDEY